MSSRRLEFTGEARHDMRAALRYTLRTWGEQQHREYAKQMNEAFQELLLYPEMGRLRDDLSEGLRSYPIGQHVIYYYVREDTVTIFRVIHQRMDARALFT